jgi:hypothetical protein
VHQILGWVLNEQEVCHAVALSFPLKGKRRIMETQIFHHTKKQSSKHPVKETKILQDIVTTTFKTSQNIIFQKSSYKNRPIITYGPKSIKLLYSIMNLNTISLPW